MAPEEAQGCSGARSVVEPKQFQLGDFRVSKPKGMEQDIGIARDAHGLKTGLLSRKTECC